MKLKDYKDKPITWQAHSVIEVLKQCIKTAKFPNGKVMTQKDLTEAKEDIQAYTEILINHGCMNNQLTLEL